jgi:alcohol dehydrogenase YqhD (iron-dependent ADH family)
MLNSENYTMIKKWMTTVPERYHTTKRTDQLREYFKELGQRWWFTDYGVCSSKSHIALQDSMGYWFVFKRY